MNVDPTFGSLYTLTCPPCVFTAPYTIDSPSPVPLPCSLVVKNGSKMRAFTSSVMPEPVSETASWTYAPGVRSGYAAVSCSRSRTLRVSMVRRPPVGMASRAFTARFRTICSSCVGSAFTRYRSGARAVVRSTSSPTSRFSSRYAWSMTAFGSITFGSTMALRLNASNWLVTAAARSPASRMAATASRFGSPGASAPSTRSPYPLMTVSRLLKSCATPPASRPTASSFWAWRNWSSSLRRSVRSRATTTNPCGPAPARSAVVATSAQNRVPSLRTRHASTKWLPVSAARCSRSAGAPAATSSGVWNRSSDRPSASAAGYP